MIKTRIAELTSARATFDRAAELLSEHWIDLEPATREALHVTLQDAVDAAGQLLAHARREETPVLDEVLAARLCAL